MIEVMGRIRYPDAFLTRSPIPRGAMVFHETAVIFEVLSKGTARTDCFRKNREYASTASVRRHVMLEQDAAVATVFRRLGSEWVGYTIGDDAMLDMPEIGIAIPLIELDEGGDLSKGDLTP